MPDAYVQPCCSFCIPLKLQILHGRTNWLSELSLDLAKMIIPMILHIFAPLHCSLQFIGLGLDCELGSSFSRWRRTCPLKQLGFLPKRETTEVWMMLQAQIELMLQSQQDYAGLSTDLRRAFNHIGRPQVFMLANTIGLTNCFIHGRSSWFSCQEI